MPSLVSTTSRSSSSMSLSPSETTTQKSIGAVASDTTRSSPLADALLRDRRRELAPQRDVAAAAAPLDRHGRLQRPQLLDADAQRDRRALGRLGADGVRVAPREDVDRPREFERRRLERRGLGFFLAFRGRSAALRAAALMV